MINTDFCEPFLDYMRGFVELDAHAIEMIAANAKEVILPKKHTILYEGNPSDKVHFMVSGEARSFYTDFTGKTITWSFHFNTPQSISKNLFAVDYRSFLSNENSSISIETLTEVKALVFTKEQVTYLIENLPVYERWMRKLNEKAFVHTYDRVFTLLTMTASERYEKLLKDEAFLLQMFSSYYIASYLGIAPQSLSRIRGQG
ncbi:Crp/Fnr family transcriptional regulator [Flavobacterium sp. LC2016-01]|uniref:Crp/Fnr family transcriptional regulator n=1 Tax=Flavobacterium sp. LC2016-01 TaxID=2675876 RepID=UPI0012BA8A23|nr:Crp/Fnr family transcriptional regulator [Flavobacterium sp. LC2016-01]MTH15845.1 cyclic nucleotide-binding domain-containing protein [Flavobacterium sp. LC2016-01]